MSSPRLERLGLRLIIGVCAGIFLLNVYLAFERWRFISEAQRAKGTVVALRELKPRTPQPEILFQTNKGERIFFVRGYRGTMVDVPAVGATVEVLYLESVPHEAIENSFAAMWGMVVIGLSTALFGITLGSVGLLLARRGGRYEF